MDYFYYCFCLINLHQKAVRINNNALQAIHTVAKQTKIIVINLNNMKQTKFILKNQNEASQTE